MKRIAYDLVSAMVLILLLPVLAPRVWTAVPAALCVMGPYLLVLLLHRATGWDGPMRNQEPHIREGIRLALFLSALGFVSRSFPESPVEDMAVWLEESFPVLVYTGWGVAGLLCLITITWSLYRFPTALIARYRRKQHTREGGIL